MDFLYRIFLPLLHCCWRDGFQSLNSVKKGKSRPTLQGTYRSLVSEPSDDPRFITCVSGFMSIGDLENCLSKRHPAIYLIINPSSWFNCSSNHWSRKGVWKSVSSYAGTERRPGEWGGKGELCSIYTWDCRDGLVVKRTCYSCWSSELVHSTHIRRHTPNNFSSRESDSLFWPPHACTYMMYIHD